jgi:hypothetical protein
MKDHITVIILSFSVMPPGFPNFAIINCSITDAYS